MADPSKRTALEEGHQGGVVYYNSERNHPGMDHQIIQPRVHFDQTEGALKRVPHLDDTSTMATRGVLLHGKLGPPPSST